MRRVSSFKKIIKDGRNLSPQGGRSVEHTSPLIPNYLDVSQSKSRSSSSSSVTGISEEASEKNNEVENTTPADSSQKSNSAENGVKSNSSPTTLLVSSVPTTETMSQDSSLRPNPSPLQIMCSTDSMPGSAGHSDSVDGLLSPNDRQKAKQLAEQLKQKIMKTSDAIKLEQTIRDENVAEYLKLATNADKQQASRIKVVFEKKNQKSNASISQLQKKLDSYHRRLKEIDLSLASKGRSRDLDTNIRTTSSGLVDTSKDSLSGLHNPSLNTSGAIRNKLKGGFLKLKNRSGSADNLPGSKDDEDFSTRYGSAEDVSSNSGSNGNYPPLSSEGAELGLDDSSSSAKYRNASVPSSPTNAREDSLQLQAMADELLTMKTQLHENRQSYERLENEWEKRKHEIQESFTCLMEEERLRFEYQLNDLGEMHQRGMSGLRQELNSMEEKIEYHAHERARDIQEALESCQTRIAKMELQQQQLVSVSVEGLEDQNARALLGKLINLLLSVMAVLLVLVSTVSGILMPFVKSQRRLLSSAIVAAILVIFYKNWDAVLSRYDDIINR